MSSFRMRVSLFRMNEPLQSARQLAQCGQWVNRPNGVKPHKEPACRGLVLAIYIQSRFEMFKSLILVGALAATAASHPNLEHASFEDHVAKYGLTFSQGGAEWHQRKALFEAERERVVKHNASGK
jgi:hypothetical protein